MISYNVERLVSQGKYYREGVCLSGDTKPTTDTTMANGSQLKEIDTSTVYYYNEEDAEWWPWTPASSDEVASE